MPDHAVLFVQLVLVFAMSESISNPLITAMLATGRIRNYQLVVGGLQMINLPVSYILLRIEMFPEVVLVVAIVISQCCLAARLLMLREMIGLSVEIYEESLCKCIGCDSHCRCSSILNDECFYGIFLNFILSSLVSFICTGITIYYIGCNKIERKFITDKLHIIIHKIR